MSKLYNTSFNNIAGNTSDGEKLQFTQDATLLGKYQNKYIILSEPTYQLSTIEFEYQMAYQNNRLVITIPLPYTDKEILFGEDSLEFARYIVSLFGLTNQIPNVTNKILLKCNLTPVVGENYEDIIRFGTNSSTFQYVRFTNNNSDYSNKLILWAGMLLYSTVIDLTITSTFDSNNNVSQITFYTL
jgi:hypothetical protein